MRRRGLLPRFRRRGRQAALDLLGDRLLLREGAGGELGVDGLAVDPDLEAATRAGLQGQPVELILELLRECFRQTDGFREVASRGAVRDL